jgi:hypothetical protein
VRIATEPDYEELLAFVWEAHEDDMARRSMDRVRSVVERAVLSRSNPVFGIIRRAKGIEAAIGLSFAEPWYSDAPILTNFLFYVHPDFRRSGNAHDLVDFGGWFGEKIGMPFVLVDWTGDKGKKILFNKKGKPIGGMYAVGAAA